MFSLPVQAQELGPDYNVVGYIDLTMDGVEARYQVFSEPEIGRSYSDIENLDTENGMQRIKTTGVTPRADGHWEFPMVEIIVTTHDLEILRSIFIRFSDGPFRNDYAFTAGTRFQTAIYGDLEMGDTGLVKFNFRGQLEHKDRDTETGETTPLAGKAPVEITGSVNVTIPEEFRL